MDFGWVRQFAAFFFVNEKESIFSHIQVYKSVKSVFAIIRRDKVRIDLNAIIHAFSIRFYYDNNRRSIRIKHIRYNYNAVCTRIKRIHDHNRLCNFIGDHFKLFLCQTVMVLLLVFWFVGSS